MAVPGAPTNLSADSTNSTTAELRWTTPSDDGGETITGYKIESNVNGAGFSTLVADTGDNTTSFQDNSLTARDNAVYRVSAINTSGTGTASDTASTTTATSEAQTITELLFNNWNLTGELSKTVTGEMNEIVHFFDRGQIPGNKKAKAVTVQKINELGNEIVVEHPKFFEQSEIFEITCLLQVPDGANDRFSVWIDLMQQMTTETIRILRTQFAPSSFTGQFFRTNTDWIKDDTFFPDDPVLSRTLRFRLTRIKSNDIEVFTGYAGVLSLDVSESSADSKPATDFIYAQVTDIFSDEGYPQIPYLTKDTTNGVGVPFMARGMFNGRFTANMFVRKSDFNATTINALDNIYLPQSNSPNKNQNATIVLLQVNQTPITSDSSNARGTAIVSSGEIQSIDIDFGGNGYDNAQALSFEGQTSGESDATGFATASSGVISTVSVVFGGTAYTNGETITIVGVDQLDTLTRTGTMKIDRLFIIDQDEDLLKCRISGQLIKATGFVVT